MKQQSPPPPRRDRKAEILAIAADAFQRRGFAAVSTRDVAAAAGLSTPAALYRHFPSKQALLATAIGSGLDLTEEAGRRAGSAQDLLRDLAAVAVERPDLWVLIRRESRHLSSESREEILARFDDLVTVVTDRVASERPDHDRSRAEISARAAIATLAAPSQYRLRQGRHDLAATLATVSLAIALGTLDQRASAPAVVAPEPFDPASSRREEILAASARLFAQRGYPDVSLDDIGAETGMSGPSLYHHFGSKAEILHGVLRRSLDWIELDRVRVTRDALDPADALTRLVGDYVSMARTHTELFRVFTHEAIYLPEADRRWVLSAHRDFIQHWVALLQEARPDLAPAEALTRVACALSVANDLSSVRLLGGTLVPDDDVVALACSALA